MRRFMKVLKAIGKGILVLAAVLVVALLVLRWTFSRQLNTEIAAIRARGEPLTMADLAGPDAPDSQNAALIYAQIIDRIATDDFGEMLGDIARNSDDAGAFNRLRLAVERHQDLLPLIEHASSMPHCDFSVDRGDGRTPDAARMWRLAQFLRANTLVNARTGGIDRAIDSAELGLKTSRAVNRDPDALSFFTSGSMISIACRSIIEITEYSDMSEAQARRLCGALADVDFRSQYVLFLQKVRALFLDTAKKQHDDPKGWIAEQYGPAQIPRGPLYLYPLGLIWLKVIFVGDQVAFLR